MMKEKIMTDILFVGFITFICVFLVISLKRNKKLYSETQQAYERQEQSLKVLEQLLQEQQESNRLLTNIVNNAKPADL